MVATNSGHPNAVFAIVALIASALTIAALTYFTTLIGL